MCLSLLVFTQLFFEIRTVGASQSGQKTEFNAGLISKISEKYSRRKRWKLPLSTTPFSFAAPPQGTSANIRTNLISPEKVLDSLDYISVADNMGVS